MMSVFFHFQHTLNIFFSNCKGERVNPRKISEKTTLKKLPRRYLLLLLSLVVLLVVVVVVVIEVIVIVQVAVVVVVKS